jgi:adenylylsulfate kinase-like enzyme
MCVRRKLRLSARLVFIRRIGLVCELLSRNGIVAIAAAISLTAPIPLFMKGYIECGIGDPYERPLKPEVTVNSWRETPEESVQRIWATLERLGLIGFDRSTFPYQ